MYSQPDDEIDTRIRWPLLNVMEVQPISNVISAGSPARNALPNVPFVQHLPFLLVFQHVGLLLERT